MKDKNVIMLDEIPVNTRSNVFVMDMFFQSF